MASSSLIEAITTLRKKLNNSYPSDFDTIKSSFDCLELMNTLNLIKTSNEVKALSFCIKDFVNYIHAYTKQQSTIDDSSTQFLQTCLELVGIFSQNESMRDHYFIIVIDEFLLIIADRHGILWFSKELGKTLNVIMDKCSSNVKNVFAIKCCKTIIKLVDVFCNCGDYEFQKVIMDILFSLHSDVQIQSNSQEMFPNKDGLAIEFCKINRNNLEKDIRTFVNEVNSVFKGVVSFNIIKVWLKNYNIQSHETSLWLDINRGSNTITIPYITSDSAHMHFVTFKIKDVKSVKISRLSQTKDSYINSVVIYFSLSKECLVLPFANVSTNYIKVLILDHPKLEELKNTILPSIFENKVQIQESEQKDMNFIDDSFNSTIEEVVPKQINLKSEKKLLDSECTDKSESDTGTNQTTVSKDASSDEEVFVSRARVNVPAQNKKSKESSLISYSASSSSYAHIHQNMIPEVRTPTQQNKEIVNISTLPEAKVRNAVPSLQEDEEQQLKNDGKERIRRNMEKKSINHQNSAKVKKPTINIIEQITFQPGKENEPTLPMNTTNNRKRKNKLTSDVIQECEKDPQFLSFLNYISRSRNNNKLQKITKESKVKNQSFTKNIVPNPKNVIECENFLEVVQLQSNNHIEANEELHNLMEILSLEDHKHVADNIFWHIRQLLQLNLKFRTNFEGFSPFCNDEKAQKTFEVLNKLNSRLRQFLNKQ
ncbi:hypothetical protein FQA39_LY06434 [Lamprigera yunnana]|nr:hypothetical protein FQA39_LY06434 [Lamprigera yunnana]